ncbi:MAG TPA: hypothetical protein VLH08_08115 [Acidobacteriota bacterium]|nr:hypothetical protein [Acidobacteriota bacterium]
MAGDLKLNLLNIAFERVSDYMEIRLEHTVLSQPYEIRDTIPNGVVVITNIQTSQGGRYVLRINPEKYRSLYRIIRVLDDPDENVETFVLPIRPNKVVHVDFPEYNTLPQKFTEVLSNSDVEFLPGVIGKQLYDALEFDWIKKAGLFNLHAKMSATCFRNGNNVFSYVNSINRIRGDRIFANVRKDLRDEVKNACLEELFKEVSGALHTPPPNFMQAGSFKSMEPYGNLQLTFFSNPNTLDFIVDADIDDANGIAHIFQVAQHEITNSITHPYDIHQILLHYQHIDPGYSLVV